MKYLIYLLAMIIATFGGAYIVKWIIRPFSSDDLPVGFPKAGWWIGIMERFLIFICLWLEVYSLIGFILTLKAIYRFGDIQGDNTQKMRLSEYFIIGTLASLSWVILIYLLLVKVGK